MRNLRTTRIGLALTVLPCALLLTHCGAPEIDDIDGEDLGPYAEQMPWNEFMATASMSTVEGVAQSSACTTAAVRGLSDQIVAQMNCIRPGIMDRIDNANISLASAAALPYLQDPAARALRAATQGRSRLSINSTLRSVAQQFILYYWYRTGRCGVRLAARPGQSNHEDGLAFDTSSYGAWRGILQNHGFRWLGSSDPVHFDYTRSGVDARGVLAFQQLWNRNNPRDRIDADGIYGPQTEARIKRSPRTGFPGGQSCN